MYDNTENLRSSILHEFLKCINRINCSDVIKHFRTADLFGQFWSVRMLGKKPILLTEVTVV